MPGPRTCSACCNRPACVSARRKRKRLTPREYDRLQQHYRNILTRAERELPPIPARQNGNRSRIAKSDAPNLWERLKEHEGGVPLFARNPHSPSTITVPNAICA